MAPGLRHGDVVWLPEPRGSGRRPVVVLTRTSAVGYLTGITVAAITTTIRGAPTEVVLDEVDGMPQRCVINLDNVNTVPKRLLGEQITHLSPVRLREMSAAVHFALEL